MPNNLQEETSFKLISITALKGEKSYLKAVLGAGGGPTALFSVESEIFICGGGGKPQPFTLIMARDEALKSLEEPQASFASNTLLHLFSTWCISSYYKK